MTIDPTFLAETQASVQDTGFGADLLNPIIITRHAGTIEWLCWYWSAGSTMFRPVPGGIQRFGRPPGYTDHVAPGEVIPVREGIAPDEVVGRVVVGNLPYHTAALAREVWAIEFTNAPPRGLDYTFQDMIAAEARLRCYVVRRPTQLLGLVQETARAAFAAEFHGAGGMVDAACGAMRTAGLPAYVLEPGTVERPAVFRVRANP